MRALTISIRLTIVLTVLLGIIYPIAMTVVGNTLFSWQAQGSLVRRDGRVVGSAIIGQNFTRAGYFHARPSAAGDKGYDATSSGGSNLGPTNRALLETVNARAAAIRKANDLSTTVLIPVDMVTASGSGLDAEISLANADLQVPRVARARNLSEGDVQALVKENTRHRWAGIFGEAGVNVLNLNLALDARTTASH